MIHVDNINELKQLEEIILSAEFKYDPQLDFCISCNGYISRYVSGDYFGAYRIVLL